MSLNLLLYTYGMPESSAFGEPDLTWINYRRGANQSATLDFCIVAHTKQTTTRFLSQWG